MTDSDSAPIPRARRGRRARFSATEIAEDKQPPSFIMGHASGGLFTPVTEKECEALSKAAFSILDDIGMSEAPEAVISLVVNAGGSLSAEGRLCFPPALVTRAIVGARRDFSLCGQIPEHDIQMSGKNVSVGTGGAAPLIVDIDTGEYRPSTLLDLYDAARLSDKLQHIHFFSRSMVACDMPDERTLDLNTAYASLAGTQKHVLTSSSTAESVRDIAAICYEIAGSKEAFCARPFLSLSINHAVPPLRFSAEACDVLLEAAAQGIPTHVNTFGQLGASSPVTIAGCVAQTTAETLAGLVVAWLANPDGLIIFGPRPMITDLRTGGMAGGCGEQAVLTAAAVRVAQYLDLPNSTIAGATDSKSVDAQSGFEKCMSVSLSAQTGANMITQACGMLSGLMACSHEAYVADNDMLGVILRTLAPIEMSKSALNPDAIRSVVSGEGHFLGHPETFKRMQTDFLYPDVSDRRSHEEWEADGRPDIRRPANARAREILATHFPQHLPDTVDTRMRERFDIRLPKHKMKANS